MAQFAYLGTPCSLYLRETMTDAPQSADDPVMAEALDWLLKVQENPDDRLLQGALIAWLAASEGNAKAYRRAQHVWQLAGEVPPVFRERWEHGAPEGGIASAKRPTLSTEMVKGVRKARRVHHPHLGRKWWLGLAGAACAACLAAFLLPGVRILMEADYRTGAGQIRDIALPDGSIVTLGASSALSVDYQALRRHVTLLNGEAFFRVEHDARRPFAVDATGVTVRDIGTAFDVNIESSTLDIAVQSGAVGVSFGSTPAETLTAGERLSIDRRTRQTEITKEPVETIAAWRAGRLVADNLSIGEVIQQLRRYYHGYIWVNDPQLSSRRVSGIYNLNDPISALKAVVEPHAGVVTEITPFFVAIAIR